MKLGDLLDQPGLIYHVGELCHDDLALSVGKGFDIRNRSHADLSTSGPIGLFAASGAENQSTCGKIGRLHQRKHLFYLRIPVLIHPVINDFYNGVNHLTKIMRRNIGSHADRNTAGTVHQQIGKTAGKNHGFLLRLIEVGHEVHSILVDISKHFHGDFGQSGLRITHGRRAVAVLGTEVSVSVNKRIASGPFLCHIDQGSVNGAVSMGMIFTHGITDDTGTFSVRLIRTVVQLDHGVKHTPLHRLQTIPHIRKRSGCDNAHGVVDIGIFHGLL